MNIPVPNYSRFMLHFWPTNRHPSKILHRTGRFRVKRMIQSRIIRQENIDIHYTNAIFSFLKKRAVEHLTETVCISADAKWKVQVGEPGYPIAGGKHVIVGHNETFAVGDHDFTNLSLIPDAIHAISEDNTTKLN